MGDGLSPELVTDCRRLWASDRAQRQRMVGGSDSYALRYGNLDILPGIPGSVVSTPSQKRAVNQYRKRLHKRGMARFEVLGLDADRDLLRSLAKRLAEDSPDSARIRAEVRRAISGQPAKQGGILDALRRSPLVGAGLSLDRPVAAERKVDL